MLTAATREADFPSLTGRVYLNSAAEGIPPQSVIEALHEYAADKLLGMDGRLAHEAKREAALQETATAYGLTPEEIGICSCSSEAYNLAALAMQFKEGDEVIINDLDFPAGSTPWLQPSCPASVKIWKARDYALRVEDLEPLLGPKTRLVTVSMVSFFNGYKAPLAAVIEAVRARSPALVALDVTQALGRIPLDLRDVDLIVSSTHKWILAGHGGGLVGVPNAHRADWTVPAGGWFNLQNAFEADRFQQTVTKPGAGSFCVGMPNYAAIYAALAGLRYVHSVGVDAIARHADPLVHACMEGVKALPVTLITPDEPDALAGILAFTHPKAEEINQRLHQRDIHIMDHAGRLRVAIHGYNTEADVETLLSALAEILPQV
jgi:cysteine desulfurase/selenocysteine lyase